MRIPKVQSEVRVYRSIEQGMKRMEAYKYSIEVSIIHETPKAVKIRLTELKEKFIFRLVVGRYYKSYVPVAGHSVDRGYIFKDINEFEQKKKTSVKECFVPKSAIVQDTSDFIELADWIIKKEGLSSYAAAEDRGDARYQIITEQLLRSKYPAASKEICKGLEQEGSMNNFSH